MSAEFGGAAANCRALALHGAGTPESHGRFGTGFQYIGRYCHVGRDSCCVGPPAPNDRPSTWPVLVDQVKQPLLFEKSTELWVRTVVLYELSSKKMCRTTWPAFAVLGRVTYEELFGRCQCLSRELGQIPSGHGWSVSRVPCWELSFADVCSRYLLTSLRNLLTWRGICLPHFQDLCRA